MPSHTDDQTQEGLREAKGKI